MEAMMKQDSIHNEKHQFPEYVQRALDDMRLKRLDALASRHQAAILSRPTAEDRKQLQTLISNEKTLQVDESAVKRLKKSYQDRIRSIEWTDFTPPFIPIDTAPVANMADFWWAKTQAFGGGGITPEFLTDGLHFFGQVSYDSDPLFPFSTGAWATFELQPERRPPSASGRYNSAPYVELFGNINGWTNLKDCPWACDDKWCKCFLYLRQSAIQFVDDIGTWRLCGENTSWRTLIDEEGNGTGVNAPLPGFLPMPPLQFGLLRPDRSVLIDLEVRFDIQLEGDSFISFSPANNPAGSVLLRYFQWPCIAA
jgi:hypothetical protein